MKRLVLTVATAIVFTTGCAGLKEIAQGSIDQFAKADDQRPAPALAQSFQIPEDALRLRDPQLAEVMHQLGRKVARGYQPKVRLEIAVGSQAEADWLISHVDRGIASTGWPREAVMLPPMVRLTNAYPTVRVTENLR